MAPGNARIDFVTRVILPHRDKLVRFAYWRYGCLILDARLRLGTSQTHASMEPEDFVNEAILDLCSGKLELPSEDRAVAFLKTILRRRMYRFFTREPMIHAAAIFDLPESSLNPEQQAESNELASKVQAALGKLPQQMRHACELHGLQGRHIKEVAQLMQIKPKTAAEHYYQGAKRLRVLLRSLG